MAAPYKPSSLALRLRALPPERRREVYAKISLDEALLLKYEWRFWARPEQLPPEGPWSIWMILAGRGWGKTRTINEWLLDEVQSGRAGSIRLVGETYEDLEETIIDVPKTNESGIFDISPPWFYPKYSSKYHRLTWPNGAVAALHSAMDPEMRGPNNDTVLIDEPAKCRFIDALWSNIELTMRKKGKRPPRIGISGTPLPIKFIKDRLREAKGDPEKGIAPRRGLRVTRGHTEENAANVPQEWLEDMKRIYGGTRLGRQELGGECLDDDPTKIFSMTIIDRHRIPHRGLVPQLEKIIISVDPTSSEKLSSSPDICGIILAGVDKAGHVYVLEDFSDKLDPLDWALLVKEKFHLHKANKVVAETNKFAHLVVDMIRAVDKTIPVEKTNAKRDKADRAEPIANLYKLGMVHHVGILFELETEMKDWIPGIGPSPNRTDALVWAVYHLVMADFEREIDHAALLRGVGQQQAQARTNGTAAVVSEVSAIGAMFGPSAPMARVL